MSGSIWPSDDDPSNYEQSNYEPPNYEPPPPPPVASPEFINQAQALEKRIHNHRGNIASISQRAGLDAAVQEQLDIFQAVELLGRSVGNEPERDLHNNCRMAQINAEALLAHRVGEVEKSIPAEYISRAYPGLRTALEKEQQALALLEKIDQVGKAARLWEKNQSAKPVEAICEQVAEFYRQYRDMTLETLTRDTLLAAAVDEYTRAEAARLMIAHANAHVQAVGSALLDRLTIQPYRVITQALKHASPSVREAGVKCFARGGVVQGALVACAADPDISVRDATSDAFRQTASLLPKYLAVALGDEDSFVRRAALELVVPPDFCASENTVEWGKIRNHLLALAERDPNLDVREKATRLLGWFPFTDATALLKRLSARQNGQPAAIQQAAIQSLAMQRLLS